jgi:3-oxoacyl-[acyl-carrier protein] reductase
MSLAIDLTGKAVLLTGGSRGIGAATVRAFAHAGASVLFTYANRSDIAEQMCRELGSKVHARQCDLAKYDSLPALVSDCVKTVGGLDVLVNNAAIHTDNPFDGADYEVWRAGWERTFAVNLFGAAHLAFLAMREMRKKGSGTIINISSRAAHRGELTFADYGASKAAMVNLSKSIARSCAKDGIKAFTVAPGFIETEASAGSIAQNRAQIEAEIPSRRIGQPEEVAPIVVFLASGMADYATGSTIDVNGASYVR